MWHSYFDIIILSQFSFFATEITRWKKNNMVLLRFMACHFFLHDASRVRKNFKYMFKKTYWNKRIQIMILEVLRNWLRNENEKVYVKMGKVEKYKTTGKALKLH